MKSHLQKWRAAAEEIRMADAEEKAGQEHAVGVARRVLRRWRVLGRLRKVGEGAERKVRRVVLGFEFF